MVDSIASLPFLLFQSKDSFVLFLGKVLLLNLNSLCCRFLDSFGFKYRRHSLRKMSSNLDLVSVFFDLSCRPKNAAAVLCKWGGKKELVFC